LLRFFFEENQNYKGGKQTDHTQPTVITDQLLCGRNSSVHTHTAVNAIPFVLHFITLVVGATKEQVTHYN